MVIVNEFIIGRTIYNNNDVYEKVEEDAMYIAELTETDEENNNIEFAIKDKEKTTYIRFRFDDLKRLVENNREFC